MRIVSGFALIALCFGQTVPALAAFSKDIEVTAVQLSHDFDTATITLSRNPGERVTVLYDLYVGESTAAFSGAETSQAGQTVILQGLRNNFDIGGGDGTQFRLQWRVCPYQEPYIDQHLYQYCSREYVMYVTYAADAFAAASSFLITKATVSDDRKFITVELSKPVKDGYVLYERNGGGAGYDYSSWSTDADGVRTVRVNVGDDFVNSGTTGKQTITLRPCIGDPSTTLGASCGPQYPLTIDLGASARFSDVPSMHPNAEAIRYVQQQGIVAGYGDGTFQPDADINRAEFVKLVTLYKFGQEMINMCATRVRFFDVNLSEAWYLKYVCRAQDAHLIDGYPDGSFRPGNRINAAEAAKIIVLADVFGDPDNTLAGEDSGPWYKRYVRYLEARNAIPTSIDRLNDNLTRGEMAEIIYRLHAGVTNKPSKTFGQ